MARYMGSWTSVTCVPFADTSADLVDTQYPFVMQGAGATVLVKFNEIYIGGESAASNPTTMIFARDSTVATGGVSVGRTAPVDVQTTAPGTLVLFGNTVVTVKPRRSATLHLLHLSLNTYGGISRWQARYGEEITQYGATANSGETSLSAITGTGISSGHVIYEIV
jgi:hypothetical protein